MMIGRIFLVSLCALLTLSGTKYAIANDDIAKVDPLMESGGNAYRFPNLRLEPPSQKVFLSLAKLNKEQSQIAEKAKAIFDQNQSSLSMLLIDKGKIIVELYRAPASSSSPQHSMSMSKSLTAYVIGGLLCEGKIKSLNDKAEIYAPELKGTVFGEASIKNLLMMSSGAGIASFSGSSYNSQLADNRAGKVSTLDVLRRYGSRDISPGQDFRYLNNDTQSLAFIIENLGGFRSNFQKHIWSKSGAEATGYWLIDKDKVTIAYAGASFVTRDWGRLALWSMKQRNKKGSCFGNFMREATSGQISNSSKRTGRYFPSYGFQTWVKDDTYWWVGYGGQRVGVDPNKGHIIVVTSSREDYMDKVYKLFNTWNKD